jgi:hypothetical protein
MSEAIITPESETAVEGARVSIDRYGVVRLVVSPHPDPENPATKWNFGIAVHWMDSYWHVDYTDHESRVRPASDHWRSWTVRHGDVPEDEQMAVAEREVKVARAALRRAEARLAELQDA